MYKFLFLLFSHLNRASWPPIRNKLSQAKPSHASQTDGTVPGQPFTWGQVRLLSPGLGFFLSSLHPHPCTHTGVQEPTGEVKMRTPGFSTFRYIPMPYTPSEPPASSHPHPRVQHNYPIMPDEWGLGITTTKKVAAASSSAYLHPHHFGREAPNPDDLSRPEQHLYLLLSSFVENTSHGTKTRFPELQHLCEHWGC